MDYNVRDVQFVQCSAFSNLYHPECKKYTDFGVDYFSFKKFQKPQKYILRVPYDIIVIALIYFIIHYYIYFPFVLLIINNKTPLKMSYY